MMRMAAASRNLKTLLVQTLNFVSCLFSMKYFMLYLWQRYHSKNNKKKNIMQTRNFTLTITLLSSTWTSQICGSAKKKKKISLPFSYQWYKMKVMIAFINCNNGRDLLSCHFIQGWHFTRLSTGPSTISF